jgi:hypothetical protein
MLMSPAMAADSSGDGQACQTKALYLLHVGASDKPIPSLIICVHCPDDGEAKRVIGEALWPYRKTHEVSRLELCEIAGELVAAFPEEWGNEPGMARFGTFKLIMVPPGVSNAVYLDRERAVRTIKMIESLVPPERPELSGDLQDLLLRLGAD